MAHWVEVAAADELAIGEMKAFRHGAGRLLLVRAEDGYHVIDEMCTHEDYSLALGCIKGTRIKCSLHGSYFDLVSGAALDEPAELPLRTYPVKTEQGKVWALLGEGD
jgi:3-phenylpropionate/trans-cinnamate dioxygenase ferredoxin subunit